MVREVEVACGEMQAAGKYLLAHGLTWGTSGNVSVRLGAEAFLVTASGTDLGSLGPDDFVVCPLDGSSAAENGGKAPGSHGRRPSKETPMHRAIYALRPEAGAVLHASPFYSTLAACSGLEVPRDWFVEAFYYLERVARVPYHHPGSQALAEAVGAAAAEANVLLLENHGALVYDTTLREALAGLETLEVACRMALAVQGAGPRLRPAGPGAAAVADLLENGGYRPRRRWAR